MTYRALVFDFFGVVCSEVAPFWLSDHLPPDKAAIIKATLVRSADCGEISQSSMFAELSKITGISAIRIEEEWYAHVMIDSLVVELIAQLKSRYSIGLLTNSPSPFVRKILSEHHLTELFETIVVSSEFGIAKPDIEIYNELLSKMSIEAEDALMIDDNPANVAAAESIGMSGLLFKSVVQLRKYFT